MFEFIFGVDESYVLFCRLVDIILQEKRYIMIHIYIYIKALEASLMARGQHPKQQGHTKLLVDFECVFSIGQDCWVICF